MRGSSSLLVLATSVAALSCGGDALTVVPPPPIDTGVHAMILAIDTGDSFEVRAFDVVDGAPSAGAFPIKLPKPVSAKARLTLEAASYQESLAALGLTAGVLAPATSANGLRLRTAPTFRRLDLDVAQPDANDWQKATEMSDKLAAFRVEGPPTRCAQFEVTIGTLGAAMRSPAFGAEVEPGVALVGTDIESFFTVRFGEVARVDSRIMQNYRSLVFAGSNTMWFGGDFGYFARAHFAPDIGIDEGHYTNSGGRIRWITAGPPTEPPDVFTLSWEGVLEHFDGTRTQVLHQIGVESGDQNAGGMARVGPHEVIVAWPAIDRAVLRAKYDVDRWTTAIEPTDGTAAFISAAYSPTFGAVVGNSNGEFYRDTGRGWRQIPDSPLRVWAFSITPYDDGFVYGSAFGNFGQYTPEEGFCPLQQLVANDIRHIVVVGRDILLLGPTTSRASYAWLHRL